MKNIRPGQYSNPVPLSIEPQPDRMSRGRPVYVEYRVLGKKNTTIFPNVDLILSHRLQRWPNIKTALGYRIVFAGT